MADMSTADRIRAALQEQDVTAAGSSAATADQLRQAIQENDAAQTTSDVYAQEAKDQIDALSRFGHGVAQGVVGQWRFITGLGAAMSRLQTRDTPDNKVTPENTSQAYDAGFNNSIAQELHTQYPDIFTEHPRDFMETLGQNVGGAVALPVGPFAEFGTGGRMFGAALKDVATAATGGAAQGVVDQLSDSSAPGLIANVATSVLAPQAWRGGAWVGATGKDILRATWNRTFNPEGKMRPAAEQLQLAASDSNQARVNLQNALAAPRTIPLTPAQMAMDQGLLQIENGMRRGNVQIQSRFNSFRVQQRQAVDQVLDGLTPPASDITDTAAYLQQNRQAGIDRLNARVQTAVEGAQEQYNRLGAPQDKALQGQIVDTKLHEALADARATEASLYAAVPSDMQANTAYLRAKVAELNDATSQVKRDLGVTLPKDVQAAIENMGTMTSVQDLQDFRSVMLDRQTAALSGVNADPAAARLYRQLADAALEDIGVRAAQEGNGGPAGLALAQAHAFSRDLNDTFTRGPIGRVLRLNSAGGDTVAPSEVVQALLQSDIKGGDNMKALNRAAGFNAATVEGTPLGRREGEQDLSALNDRFAANRDQILNAAKTGIIEAFRDQVIENGQVNADKLNRFLARNKYGQALDSFPELKAQLEDLGKAQGIADQLTAQTASALKNESEVNRSAAALFIDGNPDYRFSQALDLAKKDIAPLQALIAETRADKTGKAFNGLQRAFVQELKAVLGTVDDAGVGKNLGGRAAEDWLAQNDRAFKALFDDTQQGRLRALVNDMKRVDLSGSLGAQDIQTPVSTVLEVLARVTGARVASVAQMFGANALQTTQIGATRGANWIKNLTRDNIYDLVEQSLFDPKLMDSLLEPISTLRPERTQEKLMTVYQHLLAMGAIKAGQEDQQNGP